MLKQREKFLVLKTTEHMYYICNNIFHSKLQAQVEIPSTIHPISLRQPGLPFKAPAGRHPLLPMGLDLVLRLLDLTLATKGAFNLSNHTLLGDRLLLIHQLITTMGPGITEDRKTIKNTTSMTYLSTHFSIN